MFNVLMGIGIFAVGVVEEPILMILGLMIVVANGLARFADSEGYKRALAKSEEQAERGKESLAEKTV